MDYYDETLNNIKNFDLNSVNKTNTRILILGPTNSGKTYFFQKLLFPKMQKKYDYVYIITQPTNIDSYKEMIPKNEYKVEKEFGIITYKKRPIVEIIIPDNYYDIIEKIELIEKKQKETNFKYNVLIIYDDIIDKKLLLSSKFSAGFMTYRHWNISIVFIIQTLNKEITPKLYDNSEFVFFFNFPQGIKFIKEHFINPAVNMSIFEMYNKKKIKKNISDNDKSTLSNMIYSKFLIEKYKGLVTHENKLYHFG